jgi:AraC-like DNA-binding protein
MSAGPLAAPSAEAAQLSSLRLHSFDPRAMRMTLQDGTIEHLQTGRGTFSGTVTHSATRSLRTDWGSYNLPLQAQGDLSRDMLTLGVFIGGEGDWRVQGTRAASGDMVLLSEGGELLVNLPAQSQWLAMQVSRDRLEAAGVPLAALRGATAWRLGALQGDGGCRRLAELAPVLAPFDDARSETDVVIHGAQEQLMTTLLCEWERRRAARSGLGPDKLNPSERWRVVRRAEAYIEAHPEATLRIDDLCSAACTTISTLERVFRDVFGLTPRRYLTLRRLAGVRSDLLNGDPRQSVTEVATRWGFYHLGRFAQEYGQLYHERPSQTRARR